MSNNILLEALKKIRLTTYNPYATQLIKNINAIATEAIKKWEALSCDKSCSPSDYRKGGKCDLNGCYESVPPYKEEEREEWDGEIDTASGRLKDNHPYKEEEKKSDFRGWASMPYKEEEKTWASQYNASTDKLPDTKHKAGKVERIVYEGDTFAIVISKDKEEMDKGEGIKVTKMWDLNNIYQKQHIMVGFSVSSPIPEDKYPAIKKAIELAINLESKEEAGMKE